VGSVAGLWQLLRETRRRGQEQWFAPNRLTELRRFRLRRLIEAAGATPYYQEAFSAAGVKDSDLTQDGIPYYGNHVPCTKEKADIIANEFAKDGADDATQQWATYIASREGGCNEKTVNNNPATRDDSHCTFQLNALAIMLAASLGEFLLTIWVRFVVNRRTIGIDAT